MVSPSERGGSPDGLPPQLPIEGTPNPVGGTGGRPPPLSHKILTGNRIAALPNWLFANTDLDVLGAPSLGVMVAGIPCVLQVAGKRCGEV